MMKVASEFRVFLLGQASHFLVFCTNELGTACAMICSVCFEEIYVIYR
jgi:hypothetical protein